MKKKLLSLMLALCTVLFLMPTTTALAEDETKETSVCTCETACTEEAMNAECLVCSVGDALAENCGKYTEAVAGGEVSQPEVKNTPAPQEGENTGEVADESGNSESVEKIDTLLELQTALNDAADANSGNTTIDLAGNIEFGESDIWTPVRVEGYNGAGVVTLNGNGYTITGLNAPLFAGGFGGNSGIVIKDLTLKDVNLNDSSSEYAGTGFGAFICAVDSMPTISLTDCHVKGGTINSMNGARVGGLIGWTSGYNVNNNGPVDTYVTLESCSVSGLEITANGSVGGLIGHAGCNATTYHTIKDCSVTNCTLTSTKSGDWCVGDVVGTANAGQVTVDQATVDQTNNNTRKQENEAGEAIENGLVGRAVLNNTGLLIVAGRLYGDNDTVAIVRTPQGTVTKYKDLAGAVNAARAGDTVMLVKDVTLGGNGSLTVDNAKDFTLDLNGFTISQNKEQNSGHSLLTNNGTLVIKDSSTAGTGKITYEDTGSGGNYVSNTITNNGKLTVESGTIENTCSTNTSHNGFPYAIDNHSRSSDASLTITGGTVDCKAYSAIRLFCSSTEYTNSATISGGTIRGCVEYQQPIGANDKALGSLTIKGGNFERNEANMVRSLYIFSYKSDRDCSGMTCTISGGTFEGAVEVNQYAKGFNDKFITGGIYKNGQYENVNGETKTFMNDPSRYVVGNETARIVKRDGDTLEKYVYTVLERKNLTSGVYLTDPAGALADGYYVSSTEGGVWTVSKEQTGGYVPVDPAPAAGTLTVTKTVTGFEVLPEGYNVTINVKQGDKVVGTATLSSFTDGKATYSFYGLPAGTYTVSETAADVDGYKLEATADQSVTVTAGGTAAAAFVNAYTKAEEPVTPDDPENPDVPDKPDKPDKPEKPSKPETPKDNAVKTGDAANTGIAWGVFGAALLGLGGFAVRRRKASK